MARKRALEQEQKQNQSRLDQGRRKRQDKTDSEARKRAAEQDRERQRLEEARRERQRQNEVIRREAERQADLERAGQGYYPKAGTLYKGKNAEEWRQHAESRPANARVQEEAATALVALKGEGIPILLQFLENQSTAAGRDSVLRLIAPDLIHFNDLKKIVACLDKKLCANPTRVFALKMLRTRKESATHVEKIETLVADLKNSRQYKNEVKEMLDAIKDAAPAKPEK